MRVRRLASVLAAALAVWLVQAQVAMADGVGVAGRVTERTVTFIMFGVIGFFAIVPIALSLIQGRLEARKDRRRYDLERLG